jgi:hypothetical protein
VWIWTWDGGGEETGFLDGALGVEHAAVVGDVVGCGDGWGGSVEGVEVGGGSGGSGGEGSAGRAEGGLVEIFESWVGGWIVFV